MTSVGLYILVFLTCSLSQVVSEVYRITAADSASPCTVPCLNLSQFAANSRQYLNVNTSLVFLPGRHHLHVNLTLSNVDYFSMNSDRMTVQIVCTRYSNSAFNFSNIEQVHIANIEFIGCGGNQIKNVQQFILQDSEFKGQEGSSTALELIDTSAEIVGSMFTHNTVGKSKSFQIFNYYSYSNYGMVGGAIISSSSEIDIRESKFKYNAAEYGGAIFAYQYSTIHLKDIVFVNNTATSHGGVLYSSDSSITIEASKVDSNTASKEGGVLYSLNGHINVKESSFANNTVISPTQWYSGGNGGVFSCFSSSIMIKASHFSSNIAYSNGGVFHFSSSRNVTVKASEFVNNVARRNGAVLYAVKSSILIDVSQFESNIAYFDGSVLDSDNSNISVNRSAFSNNTAINMGGLQFSSTLSDTIISDRSNFTNNSSPIGAVIHTGSPPTNEVYYITPDPTTELCTSPCLTLSQFAIDSKNSLNSNITLVLLPGRHHLTVRLTVSYLDYFLIYSENSTAQIVCTRYSHIFFIFSQHVQVKNLTFLGCAGNQVQFVEHFILQDIYFKAQGYRREALTLQETTAWITDSHFVAFQKSGYGGAMSSIHSKIIIQQSSFKNNSAGWGGVISAEQESMVIINDTIFYHNACDKYGGIIYSTVSTIVIEASEFNGNTAAELGGILYSSYSNNITIKASRFTNNRVVGIRSRRQQQQNGGVLYCIGANVAIEQSEFNNNTAITAGGVLYVYSSTVKIEASDFKENNARLRGGVVNSIESTIAIEASNFSDNTATSSGGVLYTYNSIVTIEASDFHNNLAQFGGVLYFETYCKITVDDSSFTFNRATRGAVVYAKRNSKVNWNDATLVSNNSALEYGVIYVLFSEFNGANVMILNNIGSLVVFSGNITLGNVKFQSNQPPNIATVNVQEGGAITLLQSNAFFDRSCTLELNNAKNGGAIFSTESKLHVSGDVTIAHNKATENGGGIYLLNSELNYQQGSTSVLINNTAARKGGGIHAISSFVKVSYNCRLSPFCIHFDGNIAKNGGALSLEANTKLYAQKHHNNGGCGYGNNNIMSMIFTGNIADYGGAMYVDDDSNSGSCARVQKTECIFQVIALHSIVGTFLDTRSIAFSGNIARISGSTMYGGLLDRCAVSQFAEVNNKHEIKKQNYEYEGNGVAYFEDVSFGFTNTSKISSLPVQVCLCVNNKHNCSHQTYISVKKGEALTLSLAAVDQVGIPVEGIIQTSLNFTESGLAEGQLTREILGECTDMEFNVFSPHNSEELTMYASNGPCKDAELSRRKVQIDFLPCSCPLGFQASVNNKTSCTCECHRNISQYVEHCDSNTGTFVRHSQSRVWISHVNDTKVPGFIIYSNCPFDYCNQLSLPVDLNQPSGSDVQCAFNRSSMLCGSCQSHLSLSLGSSLCLSCPTHWPALFITITIASLLSGIALVALLLVLNMTVAVGTLNGLIFYANILYANKSILFPNDFQKANFLITFVSWLNLDIGIDTCYFPGMNTYVKTWLQFAFPAYVILLVVLVIIFSSYSSRFSNLIGRRDPVATLATLVLLSYAKLLETCFKSLSVGYLTYPDGVNDMLWLPDANVKYLSRKHVPLFIVAILILLIGLVYTTILFTWQWLLHLPQWKVFGWSRNQKLQTFIETYLAPYSSKHRYWTGLLLIVRAVLYLTAAVNFSNDPHVALTAIVVTVCCVILLGRFIACRVYRKCPLDTLETFFHLNILFFALFTWHSLSNNTVAIQAAAAYTSVIVTFITVLIIILYHMYTYTMVFSKVKKMKSGRMFNYLFTKVDPKSKTKQSQSPDDDDFHRFNEMIDHPIDTNDLKLQQKPMKLTYSVVEVHLTPTPDLKEANVQETSCSAKSI